MDEEYAPLAFCEGIKDKFLDFLNRYTEDDGAGLQDPMQHGDIPAEEMLVYVAQAKELEASESTTIYVDYDHLNEYETDLLDIIVEHYYRLEPYLRKAVQNFARQHVPHYIENEEGKQREFHLSIYNLRLTRKMRELKTEKIGKLSAFSGTVTRTSEVRPELFLATFRCLECNTVNEGIEQQFKFTQPLICSNPTCGNRKHWLLMRDQSTFVDWQRVKVQESTDEVPAGSLPRTMDVILRNDLVETARAGDKMVFSGALIPVPDVAAISAPGERLEGRSQGAGPQGNNTDGVGGLKFLGARELTYKLSFLACATQGSDVKQGMVNIRADDTLDPDEVLAQFTPEEQDQIQEMKRDPRIYQNLAKSLAPGVYGHEDIKRAILLMLFGGVHKVTGEGINLRGDINMAIIGDPSCAKSQLLKYVSRFLPRAVYTSGKSSSAAGLTASVVKESDSNEFCIEAGALMLADTGICCIDEFDKMDVKDQVAIHEAMEQQTISIAKAGIQATLNARTSILAAANPVGGRYDKSKPLKYNVALPPAILSRFDLLHVMVDEPDDDLDRRVATHIVRVHQKRDEAFVVPYTMEAMQRYIKYARSIKPQITQEAKMELVEAYKRLRSEDAAPGTATAYRITVRQLEALVRLSEALARVRCSPLIRPSHVKEAKRLVKNSIISIEAPDVDVDDEEFLEDAAEAQDIASGSGAAGGGALPPVQEGVEAAAEQGMAAGDAEMTDQPAGEDATAAGPSGGTVNQPADAAAARAAAKAATKVSRKKFDEVKNLLLMRLAQAEESGEQEKHDVAGLNIAGMRQTDLIRWYFDYQRERGVVINSREELMEEVLLVEKIVQHLLRRDNILIILETPPHTEGEPADAYMRRVQSHRIIAANPNYVE